MAVIKILKSSSSFSGVGYNERRVKNGEAVLLEAANFNLICDDSKDYINELKSWSDKNKRVKNPQLHVVISLKGKIKDEKELLTIGREWLERMGYNENPYLIYLHNNTYNSHIHIVTTRIDKNGNKIDHNFERVRSNKILNELNGLNFSRETRRNIFTLLHYSFSTKNQFFELCRDNGYQIQDNSDNIVLKRSGVEVTLSSELINFCSHRYYRKINDSRKKELQAYIFKYARLLDKDEFVDIMKSQFGLSFKFYGKDNGLYGFSVIDYKNQCIYKGSEFFSVKKINELLFSDKNIADKYNFLVNDFLKIDRFASINKINELLNNYGVVTDGISYYDIINNGCLGSVANRISNRLSYNTRLENILCKFSPESELEYRYLSRLYNLKYKDMQDFSFNRNCRNVQYYRNLVDDIILSGEDLKLSLNNYGIQLILLNDDYLIIDLHNNIVLSSTSLGFSRNELVNTMNQTEYIDDRGYFYQDDDMSEDMDTEYTENQLFDSLVDLLSVNAAGGGSTSTRKRKK